MCCITLTGGKLCSLPEVCKDEVGQHVKACKQENADLHKKQKDNVTVIFIFQGLRRGLKRQFFIYFFTCLCGEMCKKKNCPVMLCTVLLMSHRFMWNCSHIWFSINWEKAQKGHLGIRRCGPQNSQMHSVCLS